MKESLKKPIKFCREPSRQYLKMLEEYGGDPRSVAGCHAINTSGGLAERGWVSTWDSRDDRK